MESFRKSERSESQGVRAAIASRVFVRSIPHPGLGPLPDRFLRWKESLSMTSVFLGTISFAVVLAVLFVRSVLSRPVPVSLQSSPRRIARRMRIHKR
ncbi:MAG: hypothetical protein ACYC9S_06300 [Leptospirales bacterium]